MVALYLEAVCTESVMYACQPVPVLQKPQPLAWQTWSPQRPFPRAAFSCEHVSWVEQGVRWRATLICETKNAFQFALKQQTTEFLTRESSLLELAVLQAWPCDHCLMGIQNLRQKHPCSFTLQSLGACCSQAQEQRLPSERMLAACPSRCPPAACPSRLPPATSPSWLPPCPRHQEP